MTVRAVGRVVSLILALAAAFPVAAAAGSPQGVRVVSLPAPDTTGGRPLMQVLSDRRSQREFAPTPLPDRVLSNLLWAAFGVNRPDGHRTAPSARNWQEMQVYVARADGLYLYEPKAHALRLVIAEDLRAATGGQAFVADAPVNLVYVADLKKATGVTPDTQALYMGADTGVIAENVYLYCASEGLACVVRATIDRDMLAKRLQLSPDERITLAQTVGYPKR
jgi:SagB-type dehydrogenase family enzyme